MRSPRSWLFVPGDQERKIEKAAEGHADAVVLDLEDGVAPARKALATNLVAEFLAAQDEQRQRYWVRIDPTADLPLYDPVVLPGLGGIVVAKADDGVLDTVDRWLSRCERAQGLASRTVVTMPLVETAAGLDQLLSSARPPLRGRFLSFGEVDLCADLGLRPGSDERELQTARTLLVMKAAAWRLDAPVGPASTEFSDLEVFAASTRRLRRLGYGSRAAIHPAQIDVIHEVFTPSEEELALARRTVAAAEAALAEGKAITLLPGVGMIDEAVVRRARRVLDD